MLNKKYFVGLFTLLFLTACTSKVTTNNISDSSKTPSPTISVYSPPPTQLLKYTSKNNELSFMYPDDLIWRMSDNSNLNDVNVSFQCGGHPCNEPYNLSEFGIASSKQTSIDKYISSLNTSNPKINTQEKPYVLDYKKTLVDGNDAVQTLMLSGELSDYVPIVEVFTVVKGKGYIFSYIYSKNTVGKNPKLSDIPVANPDFVSTVKFNNK